MTATITEIHYGIVTDNRDDEQRGRIRVACATLVPDGTDWPEWVDPVFPYLSSSDQQNATGGWFFVPDIGVAVELEVTVSSDRDETPGATILDANDIKWRSCSFSRGSDSIADDFKTNYPNRRGFVTGAGHKLVFDDTAGDPEVLLLQSNEDGNTFLDFDQNGSIVMATSRGMLFYMNQDGDQITLLDTNGNLLSMGEDGWYITDANSTMISAHSGGLSLLTSGDVLINASSVAAQVGGHTVGSAVTATPVLKEGVVPFTSMFSAFLGELKTILLAIPAPPVGGVTPLLDTLNAALGSGAFTSTKSKTD